MNRPSDIDPDYFNIGPAPEKLAQLAPDDVICGRCYDGVKKTYPATCSDKPENVPGSVGMYHCRDCGAMLLAGFSHPHVCKPCLTLEHPRFDADPYADGSIEP